MGKQVFSYSLVSVCRAETYRIKSTIHHTLHRKTVLLEDIGGKGSCTSQYVSYFELHVRLMTTA